MERPSSLARVAETTRRRRLKLLVCAGVGIMFLCTTASCGYLVYEKVYHRDSSKVATYQSTAMYTSSGSFQLCKTATTAISSPIQTSKERASLNGSHLSTIGSSSALPLDISKINSDPCLTESSNICNNVIGLITDFCECETDGLWTIIQKRLDGSVNFYSKWTDYRDGFGDVSGEYWLGNEAIHQITSNGNYILKIVLKNNNNVTKYAKYYTFRVADDTDGYRLTIGRYLGDAGDSMTSGNNGQMFSTKDRDNDISTQDCAETNAGGWWYGNCGDANLNGMYHTDDKISVNGINWWEWYRNDRTTGFSLKETKMMLQLRL